MLVLAMEMGKIFGETDKDSDNVWVTPTTAAGAQSSTSSFLLEEDMVLRYGTCSGTGLVLSQQVQPHLAQCPCVVGTWVQSAGSLLPRHSQVKFKPSFPWDPCLGAKPEVMAAPQLHPQGATHSPLSDTLSPPGRPRCGQRGILGPSGHCANTR